MSGVVQFPSEGCMYYNSHNSYTRYSRYQRDFLHTDKYQSFRIHSRFLRLPVDRHPACLCLSYLYISNHNRQYLRQGKSRRTIADNICGKEKAAAMPVDGAGIKGIFRGKGVFVAGIISLGIFKFIKGGIVIAYARIQGQALCNFCRKLDFRTLCPHSGSGPL